ncbi:MAG: alpha/beta fold hydrolase [Myxococcota bacterium]
MPFRLAPALTFKPDELYRVPTADGSAIALGRYHARGRRLWEEPVVLGHSLGTNRFNLDFDERYSLARFLARHGFESWVLELRGHGLAGSSEGATFDTEAEHDVAAALTAVVSTGPKQVFWVGHSRGGLLAYAHLARNPRAPIRAVVTLGSPLTFELQPGVQRFVSAVGPTLKLPVVPLRLGGKAWPLGLPPDPVGKYLLRAENTDPLVIRQAISHVVADVPGGVARQFARWVRTGAFDGEDGFDYRRGLKALSAPVLAIAGAKDLLAPAPSAHLISQYASGPVELVTAGRASGFSADYGHGDLVLGRRAPEEIFPRVAEFLARHATPAPA